ncbi:MULTISPECIES: hypothetical protein [Actinoalloteichus]|uniref:DUF3137 domain-containing protein n=1 Tax=Actinoalloteichus fjordicus TaxID=1612552 RepID=A0AAC9PVC4_9PSEU|nr:MULTISPECIES: hypothetical protein [Actinoalloteichus]APU17915.1 hypothetical protein UA74_29615 [Actinoalloteichus fjordicus]APU23993.1 hypothetical protein UA75_30145 [Actinoalloteichus sp. GBA129-24]
MDALGVLTILAFGLLILGIFLLGRYLQRRKRAEFQAWADAHGWSYRPRDDRWAGHFRAPLFHRGHRRGAHHVVEGSHRGRRLVVFEYFYVERQGSGKNRRNVTYRFAVASVFTPAPRPTLEVSREHVGHRLLGVFGVKDLQLESEEFNRAFRIQTEDDRFAYDILHPRTMEWMLGDERFKALPFRIDNGDLMSWRQGRLRPADIAPLATFVVDILERVPDYVWQNRT